MLPAEQNPRAMDEAPRSGGSSGRRQVTTAHRRFGAQVSDKGQFLEGVALDKVCHGSKGREGIAHAKHEVPVSEIPQILASVMRAPGGTRQHFTGWNLKQHAVDDAVLICGRTLRQALQQLLGAEGHQQVLVVDKIDRKHGAAGEQELIRKCRKTKRFQGNSSQRVRPFGKRALRHKNEQKQSQQLAEDGTRVDDAWNRHDDGRVPQRAR